MNTVEYYLDGRLFDGSEELFLAVREFRWKKWYQNNLLHRTDGPAIIYSDGTMFWYKDGLYHREDGPAVIGSGENVEYWIDGENFSKEDYYKIYPEKPVPPIEKLKTGVWLPVSEAPDNLNEDTKKHVILYVHSDKFYNEKYEQRRAYRVNKIWWTFLGGTYFRLDENKKKPIKFFIVPEPESSAPPTSIDLKIQNIIKILDSD